MSPTGTQGDLTPATTAAPAVSATSAVPNAEDQRERFYRLMPELLRGDLHLALVLAEIGAGYLGPVATAPVAERVINVGIREQLMLGVAGGLALTGMRSIGHTFPPFLIERPFEQVKLDLGHQDLGAVLVSAGRSYGWPGGGQTHFGHRDVALLDTLDGWTVQVPGHPVEVDTLVRHGNTGTVVAVGPMADRVLAAPAHRDVTVLYAATVRPFDADGLRATLNEPDVVIVEPSLAGTSTGQVTQALRGVRHRLLALGVGRAELRHSIDDFLTS